MTDDGWSSYRARRTLLLASWAGMGPATALQLLLMIVSAPALLTLMPVIVWFVLMVVADDHYRGFRCPNCGGRFFGKPLSLVPPHFARRCRTCGFPKWSNPDEWRGDEQEGS